jgi:hypothetical protein
MQMILSAIVNLQVNRSYPQRGRRGTRTAQQWRWLARELMVLPIAINSVITTHSPTNKSTSTFGLP